MDIYKLQADEAYNAQTNPSGNNAEYYLVNSSGNIQITKTAAKDGDGWYFYVHRSVLKLYTNNKNRKQSTDDTSAVNANGVRITKGTKWESYVVDSAISNGKR